MKAPQNKLKFLVLACVATLSLKAGIPGTTLSSNNETSIRFKSLKTRSLSIERKTNRYNTSAGLNSQFVTGIHLQQKQTTSIFDRSLKVKFRINKDMNVVLSYQ